MELAARDCECTSSSMSGLRGKPKRFFAAAPNPAAGRSKPTAGACDMSVITLNSLLRPPFGWWLKRGSGMIFDWLHRVDTGAGAANNLGIVGANRDKGIAYDSCPWSTLRQALRLISLPVAGFTFVDIGC